MTSVMEQYNQFVNNIIDQLIESIGNNTVQYDYWDGGGEYSSPQHIWETLDRNTLIKIKKNGRSISLEKLIDIDETIRRTRS